MKVILFVTISFITLSGSISTQAYHCSRIDSLRANHVELINRTLTIVLAKAIGFDYISQHRYSYSFEAIEILKGHLKNRFFKLEFKHRFNNIDRKYLEQVSTDQSLLSNDFNAHNNTLFWEDRVPDGRVETNLFLDCKITPVFLLQKNYLIFREEPFHNKSFEQIDQKKDKWLLAVRKVIQNPSISSGFSQTPFEYLRTQKSVYFFKCPLKGENDFNQLKHLYGKKLSTYHSFFSDNLCLEGEEFKEFKEFVIAFYKDDDSGGYLAIPIINDLVDFTHIMTEIEFKGDKQVPLAKVIEELNKKCLICFLLGGTILLGLLIILLGLFLFWKKIRKCRI